MAKRSQYTAEDKYQIIKAYEDGVGSTREIMSLYKISRFSFYDWRYNYNKYGIDGLKESKGWKKYSRELKENAIQDYLSGKLSPVFGKLISAIQSNSYCGFSKYSTATLRLLDAEIQ